MRTGGGLERRINENDPISRGEFEEWAAGLGKRIDAQDKTLEKLDTAMFSRTAENVNGAPGVMITMQRLNAHIDTVCAVQEATTRLAKWVIVILGAVGAGIGIAKTMGWMG